MKRYLETDITSSPQKGVNAGFLHFIEKKRGLIIFFILDNVEVRVTGTRSKNPFTDCG